MTYGYWMERAIGLDSTEGKDPKRTPDVVVLDLTVWKVPEDPLMLDTETTTSK